MNTSPLAEALAATVTAHEPVRLRHEFEESGRFVAVPGFLPPAVLEAWRAQLDQLRPRVHRVQVPARKGGALGYHAIAGGAPAVAEVYGSPILSGFLAAVAGERLLPCPPRDLHACAAYVYTEPGDYVGDHYDVSFYRGRRYTALLGVLDRSSSRLVCRLRTRSGPREVSLATPPGTLVFFDGSRVRHRVTPLGPGEERLVVVMEYLTDVRMRWPNRIVSDLKDALVYFGVGAVFGRRA